MSNPLIQEQENFYDGRWRDFHYANRLKLMRCAAILDSLVATRLSEPRIIDLGCGAGWLTSILGNFGPTTGVDLSGEAILQAAVKYPHVEFIQADIFDWDYPLNEFDVVVSHEVIEHVEDQDRYLSIASGLLREGGYLILTTPNADTLYAMPEAKRIAHSNQPIENWLTRRELEEYVSKYFRLLQMETIIPGFGRNGLYKLNSSPFLLRAAAKLGLRDAYELICTRLGFGLHLTIVAQKYGTTQ